MGISPHSSRSSGPCEDVDASAQLSGVGTPVIRDGQRVGDVIPIQEAPDAFKLLWRQPTEPSSSTVASAKSRELSDWPRNASWEILFQLLELHVFTPAMVYVLGHRRSVLLDDGGNGGHLLDVLVLTEVQLAESS
jgi:hypothetical protein